MGGDYGGPVHGSPPLAGSWTVPHHGAMRTRTNSRPNTKTCIARLALTVMAACVIALTFVPSLVSGTKAAAAPPAGLTVPAYWTVASDGGIFSFGGAPFYGSEGGKPLNAPIVGIASTPDHGGYWMVASD